MTTFDRTTSLRPVGEEHRWHVDLDPAWSSLRGIHGGYLAAIAVRAFEQAHADRAVRTCHVSFVRPGVIGPAEVRLETVRRGTSIAVARVRVAQDERDLLDATITGLAPGRPGGDEWDSALADGPRERAACIPFAPPPGIGHFDHGVAVIDPADVPFAGGPRARLAGYVTPTEPRPVDAAWLTMLLDWFPPAPFPRQTEPIGGVSIDFAVHIHRIPQELPADGWLTGVFEADDAADGLALEHGRLADPSGRIVAESFHTRLLAAAKLPDMVTGAG